MSTNEMSASVLYLTPGAFDKGGISRYSRYQIRALRQILGTDNVRAYSLLAPDGRGFEDPMKIDFASLGPTRPGKMAFAAVTAATVLQDRPSVIWSAHIHFGALALGLARLTGAKMVQNVYGLEVWTDLARHNALALRWCDELISDCYATLEYIESNGLRAKGRSVVHWDCVDTAKFSPGDPGDVLARYGVPNMPGGVTLMTLGRLSSTESHKGFDRLIQMMDKVPDDVPLRLVIAGDGADRARLRERADRTRSARRIFFTGSIDESDLPKVYRAADIFALISDRGYGRGEGIPLTPLEAAACGKPILVGNQDGSREAADDGVSGFVLDPFDLDGLARLLVRLVREPELRARIGAAAHDRIVREHSFERFLGRTKDLLETMQIS